jgi:hypothetical protein
MGVLLIIIGSVMGIAALFSIIGMTVGDIGTIRKQTAKAKRAKTQRPLVSVIIRDNIHEECIASIRHSLYSKKEIILPGERIRGSLALLPVNSDIFESTTIGTAVRQMTLDPKRPAIEILRDYKPPRTLPELMRTYHDIIVAPFIAVREAFHITLQQTRWSVIVRPSVPWYTWRTRLYCIFRWLVACANLLTFAYICYVAVMLYQPEYMQIYLCGAVIWIIVAISRYPQFSLWQKIIYTVLAPVSFGYLVLLAFYAPFSPIVRRIRAATGGLAWQSSHQSLA